MRNKTIPIGVIIHIIGLLMISLPFFIPLSVRAAEQLTLAGSGANLGITRLLAEGFMKQFPDISVDIPPSIGSSGGIAAAADGAVSIGLASRELKSKELKPNLVSVPYAQVAIIIGTHSNVAEKEISTAELIDIYRGTKTKWSNGNEIIVLALEKNDSGFMVIEQSLPGFKEVYRKSQEEHR